MKQVSKEFSSMNKEVITMTYEEILQAEHNYKQSILDTLKKHNVNIKTHMVINYGKHCKDFVDAYLILKNAGHSVAIDKGAIFFHEYPAVLITKKYKNNKEYFGFI